MSQPVSLLKVSASNFRPLCFGLIPWAFIFISSHRAHIRVHIASTCPTFRAIFILAAWLVPRLHTGEVRRESSNITLVTERLGNSVISCIGVQVVSLISFPSSNIATPVFAPGSSPTIILIYQLSHASRKVTPAYLFRFFVRFFGNVNIHALCVFYGFRLTDLRFSVHKSHSTHLRSRFKPFIPIYLKRKWKPAEYLH